MEPNETPTIEEQGAVSTNSATESTSPTLSFGPELTRRRTAARLSRNRLAELSGVSNTYLKTLEEEKHPQTGKAPNPSMEMVRKIAHELGWNKKEAVRLAIMTFISERSAMEEEDEEEDNLPQKSNPLYPRLAPAKQVVVDQVIEALFTQSLHEGRQPYVSGNEAGAYLCIQLETGALRVASALSESRSIDNEEEVLELIAQALATRLRPHYDPQEYQTEMHLVQETLKSQS